MPGALPPVEQIFTANAAQFLAAIEEMVTATNELAVSIDRVTAASAGMSGSADATAASDDAAAAASRNLSEAELAAADAARAQMDAVRALDVAVDETVVACDEAAAAIDRQAVAMGEAGTAAEGATGKTAAFGSGSKTAFLAVGAAVAFSVDKAAKFQSAMTMLNTQAGVSKGQLAGLGQGVLQLAGQVGENPDSLAESLYHVESNMASLGISAPRALSMVQTAAEGARVGGANLVDVTNALTAAVASGIPGVQNYDQAMGMLNATVGSGDMKMQDLADAFGSGMVAVVKGYGLSLKDVGAALATFGDNNIRAAKAGTDLRMAVQALAVPMKTAPLSMFGLQANTLAKDMQSGGLLKALNDLTTRFHTAGLTAKTEGEYITALFGKKAGSGVAVLLEQMDRLRSKYPAITKAANDFGGAWATTQKTVGQQWANMKEGADALAISFGEVLLPAATKIIGAVAKFLQFLEQHKVLAEFAGAVIGIAVALKLVEGAMNGIGSLFEVSPWTVAVVAVAALAVGLYELYRHSKLVRDIVADVAHFFEAAWRGAMLVAGAAVQWFTNGPLAFIKQQIAAFAQWWQANHKEIEEVARVAWAIVTGLVKADLTIIEAVIKVALAAVEVSWRLTWGLVRDITETVFNVMAATIRTTMAVIRDVIAIILDVITGHWSAAWKNLQKLAHDAVSGALSIVRALLSGFVKTMFDLGANLISGFIHGIESLLGAVGNAANSIAHAALSSIKSVLGIASPSREAYWHGQMFAQGLVNGMDSYHGQVAASAGRLAGAMSAGAHGTVTGAAGTAAGPGGVVINVTVPGGFVGNQQELAAALQPVMIKAATQFQRRNTTNGLALTSR